MAEPEFDEEPAVVKRLLASLPQRGRVEWIGVRDKRRVPPATAAVVEAIAGQGLAGDHTRGGKRQVTLVQAEHLVAVAGLLGRAAIDPAVLRRNLVVSGINLIALKDRRFRIGGVLLEGTGPCHPCSRMEEALGPGGFNAMRGHGGITARVIESGRIAAGDAVVAESGTLPLPLE